MAPLLGNIVFDAFVHSSSFNQLIAVVLSLASLSFWVIMIGKAGELRIIDKNNRKFFNIFKKQIHPIQYFHETKGAVGFGTPIATIYATAIKELTAILRRKGYTDDQITEHISGAFDIFLTETEVAAVRAQAEGELSEQILFIESRMSTIGTFTSTAPSVGLLGTVWGVMEAFMAMASSGSAMITSVAPGISGALLTTVLGLVIAIPSAIGYNALSDRARATIVKAENFTDELLANIARMHAVRNEES